MAESVLTLPACIVFSALLWWMDGLDSLNIGSWLVCMFTTYLLAELDNVFQLIRFRTRLISCYWLFVSACLNFLHPLLEVQLPACSMAVSCFFLLHCYQRFMPVGSVFHSFLFLSAGSLLCPPMLLMAVPFYVCLHVYMNVRKWRTLWAAVIGLLLPYAGWSLWCLWHEDFQPLAAHFQEFLYWPSPAQCLALPVPHLVSAALLVVLCLLGIVYYAFTSFSDKIRVRMLFGTFIVLCLCIMAGMVCLPARLVTLMSLLLMASAPLVARFFTNTHSRWSNWFFVSLLLLLLGLAAWGAVKIQ